MAVIPDRRMACLFDIDGTLSNNTDPLHRDKPNADIVELAYLLHVAGYAIIICTGRSSSDRDVTDAWLLKNNVIYDRLYMRRVGDCREDCDVKLDFLFNIKWDGFSPVMVFDDRTSCVKAWRKAGLRCLQVADGDF